jgi:hypothetical protein
MLIRNGLHDGEFGQAKDVGFRMSGRDAKIYREAAALWRELFGEAPPTAADARSILEMITRRLPESSYERLRSPHLRASSITWPKRRDAGESAR